MNKSEMRAGGAFPATRHTLIERIRDADSEVRRDAFGDLAQGYWKPLYKYLRFRWRLEPADAQDLTQGFFADAFQKAWLEGFDPGKARFRTFVRMCADRFVMNRNQSASRLKRGGGRDLSVDFESAERELMAQSYTSVPEPDAYFYDEFVRAVFDQAVRAVRTDYVESGRQTHFALFERHDLTPGDDLSYAELAAEFGLTTSQVTNYLAHVRRHFRERALETLRALCASDAEFRREARDLFGLEVE
jgi:RNA polymerase sigma factor (sigma-70 family)